MTSAHTASPPSSSPPAEDSIPSASESKGPSPWIFVLLLALLAYPLLSSKKRALKAGEAAPELSLYRLATQEEWTPKWKGVTVLHFWATWCKICVRHLDTASHHANNWQVSGSRYLLVNVDTQRNAREIRQYLQARGIRGQALKAHHYDHRYRALKDFRVLALPSVVLVDAKGKVLRHATGYVTPSALRAFVRQQR